MWSGGQFLPDPTDAVVLHRLGLLRTDEFPDVAAHWLASGIADTQSVPLLAGCDPHDVWGLDALLANVIEESGRTVPESPEYSGRIALAAVASRWAESGDTRWAVRTLAQVGNTNLELDLGPFVGLNDEWEGGWGRDQQRLAQDAEGVLRGIARPTARAGAATPRENLDPPSAHRALGAARIVVGLSLAATTAGLATKHARLAHDVAGVGGQASSGSVSISTAPVGPLSLLAMLLIALALALSPRRANVALQLVAGAGVVASLLVAGTALGGTLPGPLSIQRDFVTASIVLFVACALEVIAVLVALRRLTLPLPAPKRRSNIS